MCLATVETFEKKLEIKQCECYLYLFTQAK